MKRVILLIQSLAAAMTFAGCSCAIFHEDYAPNTNGSRLSSAVVNEVAVKSGFKSRSVAGSFKKQDIELQFYEDQQVLMLQSSYCPFVPFRINPNPWSQRCQQASLEIQDGFEQTKIPLKRLSLDERRAIQDSVLGR